jgi:hypothetical protein
VVRSTSSAFSASRRRTALSTTKRPHSPSCRVEEAQEEEEVVELKASEEVEDNDHKEQDEDDDAGDDEEEEEELVVGQNRHKRRRVLDRVNSDDDDDDDDDSPDDHDQDSLVHRAVTPSPLPSPSSSSQRQRRLPHVKHVQFDSATPLMYRYSYSSNDNNSNHKGNTTATTKKNGVALSSLSLDDWSWWTKHERSVIRERNHTLIDSFTRDHADKVQQYRTVFEQCQAPPTLATSEFLEQAVVRIPTYVRGLEWGIVPPLKQHRKVHLEHVLQSQRHLRKSSVSSLSSSSSYQETEDIRLLTTILATRAMQSSRPSRVMARLMAEGDALSVVATTKALTTGKLLSYSTTRGNGMAIVPIDDDDDDDNDDDDMRMGRRRKKKSRVEPSPHPR